MGEEFDVVGIDDNGDLLLNKSVQYDHTASFVPPQHDGKCVPSLLTAEVINLSRNIVVSGDNFKHVGCSNNLPEAVIGEQTSVQGCRCSSFRSQCTLGLHNAIMGGSARISNTRVERCGQRGKYIVLYVLSRKQSSLTIHAFNTSGIEGKYCFHFHKLGDCLSCSFKVRSNYNEMFLLSTSLGNTFHGNGRFGTYALGFNYPKETDQSILTNGYNIDKSLCSGFDNQGIARGVISSIVNNVDYNNAFVGHYSAGNIQ